MRTKRLLILVCLGLFFAVIWFYQSKNILGLSFVKSANLNIYDEIVLLNNSAFGYSSIQAYALFYVAPFLIVFQLFFLSDRAESIVRNHSRDHIFRERFGKILLTSLLFSLGHTMVNLILTYLYVETSVLHELNFFQVALFNTVGIFFFYSFIGLLYGLINDRIGSRGLSLFITVILVGVLFFVEKLFLSQTGALLKDLVIYTKFLQNEWGIRELLYTYVRQLLFIGFIYFIGSFVFVRKDIY
ncbi:WxPxxD family membrane protein [Bacillus sp. NTK074B]|uniref:WxPxxD family membrane protein n=1 Tax=Bacillus sp. NTK074B TaxID=2802174 RepID=UPI001A8ECF68|nr:WxPxxD family membrane protein [Bacillus sp. NTK074B]